nr:FmdE family protein [Vulcanisaeta sp. JCM 16159]
MAGKYALKLLGIERERDSGTYVFSETGDEHHQECFDDGVQAATGCTYGKGLYKRLYYGKLAIILYRPGKGAVRVAIKSEFLNELGKFEFFRYRRSGIPASQVPREVVDEVINFVLSKDPEEVFKYEFLKDFNYRPAIRKAMSRIPCDSCGELVFENYIKIFNGKKLCPRCYETELRGESRGSL